MPSRTRRQKSRKRKASSRRKRSSRKSLRRCVPQPRANAPSSDEEFVLESEGEESSFDFDGSLASSADEGTEEEDDAEEEEEEEEEGVSVNARNEARVSERSIPRGASRASQRQRRRRRCKPDSSDEELNVALERDDGSAGEGSRSARTHRRFTGNSVDDEDCVMDVGRIQVHGSRPARVHHRRREQDSADEDVDMDIEKVLQNNGRSNEGPVGTPSYTRPMDAGQVSDSRDGGLISELEGRSAIENPDALPKANSRTGGLSISNSITRGASSIDKDTAANKRKGKEKVLEGEELTASLLAAEVVIAAANEDVAAVTAAVVCGICLSETAVVERGKLDCCDHFFCFGCIMEWAKVESRCPMCKQRFATVAKSGSAICKRTRTIRIPLRDQVYIPPEDDPPFEDPYADVVCMECHGTGDEGLLLLCDRCDSAAHTFCVGLGRSVPRGDWYCRECQALIGESSGNENEAEELVLASDIEEEDFLLRSIVTSEREPRRQRRVQRTLASISEPSSQPRRRLRAGERRLWRRLLSRRGGSSRLVAAAPRLSQTARAFLSSITTELNPVSRVSEATQAGSARTVPQQRRLQERITAMRNNWGRIQNGDVQFDAVRTQAPESVQPTLSSSRIAAPVSSLTPATISNRVDMDSAEISSHGDKDLNRAWRMLGQARNLSSGTSTSGMQQQRSVFSHHVSMPSPLPRSSQPTASTIIRTTSTLPSVIKTIDRPTNDVSSPPSDSGIKRGPKEQVVFLGSGRGLNVQPALTTQIEDDRTQEHPSSSSITAPIDCRTDSRRTAVGRIAASFAENHSNNREKTAMAEGSKPQVDNAGKHSEKKNVRGTHNLTGIATNKVGIPASSPQHEDLKIHLTELVKKQTWPVYIAERLDKEQFKRIARAAVHSLLALCDPNNKSLSLSCNHLEDHGKNPVVNCCKKCLDQHVEDAVRTAKDKIVPR